MSLNTVIIAIIVLVVLVVLVMIFTGYFGKIFTPTVSSCISQGGVCDNDCAEYGNEIQNAKGCDTSPNTKCCGNVPTVA